MTLKKRIESTTGDSDRSWTTRWTIFTAGWWRFLQRAMHVLSGNIHTPRLRGIAKKGAEGLTAEWAWSAAMRRVCALLLTFALASGGASEALAQHAKKKKKIKKPAPVP